ncbi:MAG TPA: retroviral-like aspartic protease family protein [Brevundimonas sp.]|nr:retroviral-like aspartic protease family protein [Brevundimonas sp.]
MGAAITLPSWPALAQEIDSPGDPLPIQLVTNLFTRVAAAAVIDGRGPFSFVIDTGAGSTSISDTLAGQLGLRSLPPMVVHGITEARVTPCVAIGRLRLSGLGFRNLACPVFPREQLGADGLLGLDVLGRFKLRFDVARRAASLTMPGISITMGGETRLGTRLPQGMRSARNRFGQMILTQVVADGQPVAAFIDSGAQYSIGNRALARAVTARRPVGRRTARPVPVYGVTGESLTADLLQIDDLRLGSSRLGATPLLFADLHCFKTLKLADRPALLIGADLLGRFREVTMDFPSSSVGFVGLRRQIRPPVDLRG